MVAIIKHLPDPHLWEKNWQAMHVQYFKKAATNNLVKVVFFKTAFHCDKNNIYKHFHIYSFQIQIKRTRNTVFEKWPFPSPSSNAVHFCKILNLDIHFHSTETSNGNLYIIIYIFSPVLIHSNLCIYFFL